MDKAKRLAVSPMRQRGTISLSHLNYRRTGLGNLDAHSELGSAASLVRLAKVLWVEPLVICKAAR
jgi:hypothetical protein